MDERATTHCRCLLAETNQTELAATITDYVNNIPPEIKTPPAEYLHRLQICKECPHLRDGMCVLCGCYVEARAAKRNQKCVEDASRWNDHALCYNLYISQYEEEVP